MNFVTIADLNNDILNGIHKIPKDVDLIIGVPRSGMLVASIIALYMNKPLADIDGFTRKSIFSSGSTKNLSENVSDFSDIRKVLVVEDSSYHGNSIREAKAKLNDVFPQIEKIYFAAYVTNSSKKNVDIWLRVIEDRAFEWNLMHHVLLKDACVDIDGILCIDPTPEENDDGDKYINFILNAKPKYIPTRKIGYIVTSRLEKYRKETEKWLADNGIEYDKLIMLDGVTAEERRKLGNHGKFKAEVFKSIPSARIFIESEPGQAKVISEITKKDVFCPQGSLFFRESNFYYGKRSIKRFLSRIIRGFITRLPGYNRWKHGLKKILRK